MPPTLYESMDIVEKTRMDNDSLLLLLLGDVASIDKCLQALLQDLLRSFPDASQRRRDTLQATIAGTGRASKHAFLFFGLHTRPVWCRQFLKDHNVPVAKFKRFYENGLKLNTEKLLCGKMACIQEYAELLRTEDVVT